MLVFSGEDGGAHAPVVDAPADEIESFVDELRARDVQVVWKALEPEPIDDLRRAYAHVPDAPTLAQQEEAYQARADAHPFPMTRPGCDPRST